MSARKDAEDRWDCLSAPCACLLTLVLTSSLRAAAWLRGASIYGWVAPFLTPDALLRRTRRAREAEEELSTISRSHSTSMREAALERQAMVAGHDVAVKSLEQQIATLRDECARVGDAERRALQRVAEVRYRQ